MPAIEKRALASLKSVEAPSPLVVYGIESETQHIEILSSNPSPNPSPSPRLDVNVSVTSERSYFADLFAFIIIN